MIAHRGGLGLRWGGGDCRLAGPAARSSGVLLAPVLTNCARMCAACDTVGFKLLASCFRDVSNPSPNTIFYLSTE